MHVKLGESPSASNARLGIWAINILAAAAVLLHRLQAMAAGIVDTTNTIGGGNPGALTYFAPLSLAQSGWRRQKESKALSAVAGCGKRQGPLVQQGSSH